jgi:hypothetical protein
MRETDELQLGKDWMCLSCSCSLNAPISFVWLEKFSSFMCISSRPPPTPVAMPFDCGNLKTETVNWNLNSDEKASDPNPS